MKFRLIISLSLFISALLFYFSIELTQKKIGQPFPGYLTFKNGVVGAFYMPEWPGPKEGKVYHHFVQTPPSDSTLLFSKKDYISVVLIPALAGIFFVLFGTVGCFYLPESSGRTPLLLFHFLVGNYLILSPEFHLTYHFSFLHLLFFSFIPASMIHFALLFPEENEFAKKHSWLRALPYVGSVCLAIPYLFFFERNPMRWIQAEYAVVFGVILSYLFWLGSLGYTLRRPHLEFNRIIARYLLLGQLIAFTVPLLATLAVFMFKISIPLNFSAPFVLLFPIALFLGIILGRLRQSQMQLIQAEKMATLGNLFAGLTHEINNPLTFVYSNLEPLRESLHHLKEKILSSPNPPDEETQRVLNDLDPLVDTMEEGATRAKKIIETFRSMSRSGESEVSEVDLNFLTQQSLNLLSPKWKNRIQIETHFSALPLLRLSPTEIGQVLMNVLSNAFESIPQRGVVTVTTRGSQKWVEVCVKDSGEGIPKSSLSKIFDPFYTTKPQGQGTGLGLAIVFQKVKKCGGTIEVKSEVGRGTEVVVRLPCKTL